MVGVAVERPVESTNVGLIGLGVMGRPMARRLRDAGHSVAVYSRSPVAVAAFAAEGFVACNSPREVAVVSEVVITSLPDDDAVRSVVLDGIVAHDAAAGRTFVETSTISPATARDLARAVAAAGGELVDAPVSGGEVGAIEGRLTAMVGGTEEAFGRVEPILHVLASRVIHVGPVGSGQVVKACNQLIVLATIEALSEALVLARAAGVDADSVRQVLVTGYAGSRLLEVAGRRMVERDFRPGGRARFHVKDITILRRLAAESGVRLSVIEEAARHVEALLESGGGDLDHAALVTIVEDECGVQLGRPPTVASSTVAN